MSLRSSKNFHGLPWSRRRGRATSPIMVNPSNKATQFLTNLPTYNTRRSVARQLKSRSRQVWAMKTTCFCMKPLTSTIKFRLRTCKKRASKSPRKRKEKAKLQSRHRTKKKGCLPTRRGRPSSQRKWGWQKTLSLSNPLQLS